MNKIFLFLLFFFFVFGCLNPIIEPKSAISELDYNLERVDYNGHFLVGEFDFSFNLDSSKYVSYISINRINYYFDCNNSNFCSDNIVAKLSNYRLVKDDFGDNYYEYDDFNANLCYKSKEESKQNAIVFGVCDEIMFDGGKVRVDIPNDDLENDYISVCPWDCCTGDQGFRITSCVDGSQCIFSPERNRSFCQVSESISVDSDGDGVPDEFDAHPNGGGRNITKFFEWQSNNLNWTWDVSISSDLFNYYEIMDRPEWEGSYDHFAEFVDFEDTTVDNLADSLKSSSDKKDFNFYESVMHTVRFVQTLPYILDEYAGFDNYTKFPIQTLVDGSGDCEDAAILTAALLKRQGIDVKLLYVKGTDVGRTDHVAIIVAGQEFPNKTHLLVDNKKYYYIETTGLGWDLGEIPNDYKDVPLIPISLK